MTLTQITIFFLAILSVIGSAMVVHSWIDKRQIRKNFLQLTSELPGDILQETPLVYPRFSGQVGGRQFDLFFTVVRAGRHHILYYIYSLKSAITCDLLLLKSEYFKPIADESQFAGRAGAILPGIHSIYQARSQHPETARQIYEQGGVQEHLHALEEFSSLQLGPDAVVAGKPYDGPSDTEPMNILRNVQALERLAEAIERCHIHA